MSELKPVLAELYWSRQLETSLKSQLNQIQSEIAQLERKVGELTPGTECGFIAINDGTVAIVDCETSPVRVQFFNPLEVESEKAREQNAKIH